MEDYQFDIRAILGLLRRRFWLIVVTVVVVVGVAALSTLALKPAYTATTLVLVDTSKKDVLDPNDQSASSATDSARVDSEVELVKSETTLLRVIKDSDLIHDPEFAYRVGWRDRLLDFLKIKPIAPPDADTQLKLMLDQLEDAVHVQRRGLTYIISIDARSISPETAARISNAVADAYIRQQLDAKVNSMLTARDIVQGRIPDAYGALIGTQGAVVDFFTTRVAPIAATSGDATLMALANQLIAANAEGRQFADLADAIANSSEAGNWDQAVAALHSAPNLLKDDVIEQLNLQLKSATQNLAATTDTTSQVNLRAQLAAISGKLKEAVTTEATQLRQQAEADATRSSDVVNQINPELKNLNLPPDVTANMYTLLANQTNATSKYNTLLARENDLDVNAYLQLADSRVVSPASAPSEASFPNTRLILAISALAALALGVGLAFLYENFIGGFTSEEQLEGVLGAPVVTAVPRKKLSKRADGTLPDSLADALLDAPLSVFAEAVRRVRARLDLSLRNLAEAEDRPDGRGAVVMITSTAPNEGKTTTALSLARAYAMSGRTTLLIDCDLRKPSVHRHLALEPSAGLVDYLTSGANGPRLADFTVEDPLSPVQVALGGRRSDVATDQLVANSTFARLLDAAASVFDVVILDTPPVGPVVDGIYLAQYADVIAFVVEARHTSQQDARKALNAIGGAKRNSVEVLLILNQFEEARSAYYYKYKGYYAA
jgi:succinoglycan biosynthesis transport protein ExoP